jgi:hypothetical protein
VEPAAITERRIDQKSDPFALGLSPMVIALGVIWVLGGLIWATNVQGLSRRYHSAMHSRWVMFDDASSGGRFECASFRESFRFGPSGRSAFCFWCVEELPSSSGNSTDWKVTPIAGTGRGLGWQLDFSGCRCRRTCWL